MTQLIIDAENLAWRSISVLSELEWGLEFGFLRSLVSLARRYNATRVRVAWGDYCAWRREVYPAYKGSTIRKKYNPLKLVVINRLTALKHVLSWIMPQYHCAGCEADDVVSWLCHAVSPEPCVIVSSDRDFLQLVTNRVTFAKPSKGDYIDYTPELVKEEWGALHPSALKWIRAYCGDASDNIKGCRVPKKLVAKCVRADTDQDQIEDSANLVLTPGRLKQFLNFRDQAATNYEIISLSPPRVGPYVRCEFNLNLLRFNEWMNNVGMAHMRGAVFGTLCYGSERTPLEAPQIQNPYPTFESYLGKSREKPLVPSCPQGNAGL